MRSGKFLVAALAALWLVACNVDDLLRVDDPDVANPESLNGAGVLPTLLAGAIGDFGLAFGGGGAGVDASPDGQIASSGLLADELIDVETFPNRIAMDGRRAVPSDIFEFAPLARARAAADRAAARYRQFAPEAAGLAEVLSLSGYTYVLYSENFCGAVPVSTEAEDGTITFGAALSTTELLDRAIAKFDSAIVIASTAGDTRLLGLAQVGKARALVNQGNVAAAAGVTAGVATTFQYLYEHAETTNRQNNGMWLLTFSVARLGVSDLEGSNGLPYRSAGDPRVPSQLRPAPGGPFGADGATPQHMQLKYSSRGSSVIVADGVEARLIEAEAQLAAADDPGALATLNALRADPVLLALRGLAPGALPPLVDAGTPDARVDQLFTERAYWMWLTSHRLGDLRRLVKQYGRGPETVFPMGAYHKSGVYGDAVNLPVPQIEQNNPNYDAGACHTNQA